MHPLLAHLRDATAASHETLDAAFGSLDLSQRADYVRFLSGHAIGMAPLFTSFRGYVEGELQVACPDFPAMLRNDLAALGIDAQHLPRVDAPGALTGPATAYVVAGSRLGLAMIRKGGYWGSAHDLPSTYMEDDSGRIIWKDVVARLKHDMPDDAAAAHERAAAVVAFETFRAAFIASATEAVK